MAVAEGKFVLYSRIDPPLTAGDYRLTATQTLEAERDAETLDANELPVAPLNTHFRVRSPRFVLPPDQVLSTFPPANSEGNYGARLPQVVIKRRTLPWERDVGPGSSDGTPWLALVLIAEGEAELKLNQRVSECITPGTSLDGVLEVETGNYLLVRKSIVDAVFPTRLDVPLLAHAREVDVHDTELMMGDDDGYMAVVIANRLPLPARDEAGNEVPKKYLACLINLEQQFERLRERAPAPEPFTLAPVVRATVNLSVTDWDHQRMGTSVPRDVVVGGIGPSGPGPRPSAAAAPSAAPAPAAAPSRAVQSGAAGSSARANAAVPFDASLDWSGQVQAKRGVADVYADMARPFGQAEFRDAMRLEPIYRFPVLLHWSFTSVGQTTFRQLIEDLDAGLLGTVTTDDGTVSEPPVGRPPLESVETGHVGLGHRTRRGDEVRVWYRGPLVPHPTRDPSEGRLPLAHASDQLRIVVPDGREDLSLASAFEIGRLLALARPAMIAALLRFRQLRYQAARRDVIWQAQKPLLDQLEVPQVTRDVGVLLGRRLARAIARDPELFLGDPRPLAGPGRPLPLQGSPLTHVARGLALSEQIIGGPLEAVVDQLRRTPVPVAEYPEIVVRDGRLDPALGARLGRDALVSSLDRQLVQLVVDTLPNLTRVRPDVPIRRRSLAPEREDPELEPERAAVPSEPDTRQPDALDRLIEALRTEDDEDDEEI